MLFFTGLSGSGKSTLAQALMDRILEQTDRTITSLSGVIRHGNSGGPAIDSEGHVQVTVFATKIGEPGGFGVPAEVVRKVINSARSPVDTGPCAP